MKPDLILTGPTRPEMLRLLEKIAPTFVSFKRGEQWKASFKRIASALNRTDEANRFLTRYANKAKAWSNSQREASLLKTVSIVRWNPKGPIFMYEQAFASLVLADMGFTRPKAQRIKGVRHSSPVSFESIKILDADLLFLGTLDSTSKTNKVMREAISNSHFKSLSAVQKSHLKIVDGSKWTSIGGPTAALSIIEEVENYLKTK